MTSSRQRHMQFVQPEQLHSFSFNLMVFVGHVVVAIRGSFSILRHLPDAWVQIGAGSFRNVGEQDKARTLHLSHGVTEVSMFSHWSALLHFLDFGLSEEKYLILGGGQDLGRRVVVFSVCPQSGILC